MLCRVRPRRESVRGAYSQGAARRALGEPAPHARPHPPRSANPGRRHRDPTKSGDVSDTVLAFCIGAGLMLAAGIVAGFLAIDAERHSLEDIAPPLSSVDRDAAST